jgi:hypothetical protein
MDSPSDPTGQSLIDWCYWKNYQLQRITFPDGYVLTIGGEMKRYRFWYQDEVFHHQSSQIDPKVLYFEDWCWMVLSEHRFFSPNTHELILYSAEALMIDIYLEKGYGYYDQS